MPFSIRAALGAVLVPLVAGALVVPAQAQSKEEKKAAEAKVQTERMVLRVVDTVMGGKLAPGAYSIKAGGKDDPVASPADSLEIGWRPRRVSRPWRQALRPVHHQLRGREVVLPTTWCSTFAW